MTKNLTAGLFHRNDLQGGHVFLFSAIVGVVSTLAGGGRIHEGSKTDCKDYSSSMMDGIGTEARFNYPWGIEFDPGENVLYVADCVSFSWHIFF